jgi:hypothetical protein
LAREIQLSRWPVIFLWIYLALFPVSLLQSVMANPAITNLIYALKGALVLSGFLYIFCFRRKVIIPLLGLVGLVLSVLLNAFALNKIVIDIWVLYLLSYLFINLTAYEQRKVIRYSGWMYLITPFILVAGTFTGLVKGDVWVSEEGLQFSFGLANPNYFMFFFLYACFCWMLLKKRLLLILSFTAACLFYYITETRSVLYGGLYILLLFFAFDLLKKVRFQLVSKAIAIIITLLINACLLLMLIGYYDVLEMIAFSDDNLRSRVIDILEVTGFLRSNLQVLLFGGYEAKLDNLYLNLITALGIIYFAFLWIMIQVALLRNISVGRFDRFTLITAMLLIGFIEHSVYSTVLPSVLLFVFVIGSRPVVFKGIKNETTLALK